MKVSNQNEYNKFLEKRGNIFRYIDEAIENWYENSPKMQGGNYIYSDKVVILVHIIVNLFNANSGLRKEESIGNRRLFGFDGIGNESRKDMNQKINRGSMASVFNF